MRRKTLRWTERERERSRSTERRRYMRKRVGRVHIKAVEVTAMSRWQETRRSETNGAQILNREHFRRESKAEGN